MAARPDGDTSQAPQTNAAVMAGLDPAIHRLRKTSWDEDPGSSPMKPGRRFECGADTVHHTRKIPPRAAGLSSLLLPINQIPFELAVLLALLTLPALATLTVGILLLLARLLAAALLLAGFLTRVLILLARILVLVGHSGSPFCVAGNNAQTTTRAGNGFGKLPVPPRSLRGGGLLQW
jgi:hypothetical protein